MSERKKTARTLSEAQERYVECIADEESRHGHAHVSVLATALGVEKPSVVQMIARLEEKGIVKRKEKEVSLTGKGRTIADELQGRHAVLQDFMERQLGMNSREANQEACRLEHVVSHVFMRGIRKLLKS